MAGGPGTRAALRALWSQRNIAFFILAMGLWNLANGAMLPLLGQKLGLDDARHSALDLSIRSTLAQAVMIAVALLAATWAQHGRSRLLSPGESLSGPSVQARGLEGVWLRRSVDGHRGPCFVDLGSDARVPPVPRSPHAARSSSMSPAGQRWKPSCGGG
ncbi:hypothetical protein [Corallococcus aberystwythensis]|uniref:Uncharacterized protein n=1 Tax=Corallococcus aberystwythensis TaxID=2316722 RepID=A0A3A8R647_9BACT|nr:hypothetical protein [Corallococcus aberystwythensis]RKH74660.1 hypothetical protein D7W81_00460 [Corallococcus aberystwythensis]